MTMIQRPFSLAVLLLGLSTPVADACNPGMHVYTFFEEFRESLQEELMSSERVGRVRILATQSANIGWHITTVQVTESLKGLQEGDIFFVLSRRSFCPEHRGMNAGGESYIAGEFDDRGFFVGAWTWEENDFKRVEPFVSDVRR